MLRIVIAGHCFGCEEAERLFHEIRNLLPHLRVELLDIGVEGAILPEGIVAVPAYVLNGETIFLGNPRIEELIEKLTPRQV